VDRNQSAIKISRWTDGDEFLTKKAGYRIGSAFGDFMELARKISFKVLCRRNMGLFTGVSSVVIACHGRLAMMGADTQQRPAMAMSSGVFERLPRSELAGGCRLQLKHFRGSSRSRVTI